jgi:peptidoglycan/LPS O-acetylase OafA/YrhL
MQFFNKPISVTRRIELDFLRGIAILLVMGAHFKLPVTGVIILDLITSSLRAVGGVGVNLFFALSGFLVGGLLLKELGETGKVNASKFLIRRTLKIWPAFYFLMLIQLVVGHHPADSYLWQSLFHVQNYFGSSIKQTWSLAVEEHFYLFLAFFISYHSRKPPRTLLVNLFVVAFISIILRFIAVHYGYLDAAFRQTQFRMDSLLFGVILSVIHIFYRDTFDRIATHRLWLFISFFILLITVGQTTQNQILDRNVGYLVQGVTFPLLILQVLTSKFKLKNNMLYSFIAWVGLYSYGIYLWHTATLRPGEKLAHLLLNQGVDNMSIWFIVMAFQMIVSLMLGFITTLLVEWPFLRFRERIYPSSNKNISSKLQ